jgi:diguanylate cyclase (GGDEF)-like protein
MSLLFDNTAWIAAVSGLIAAAAVAVLAFVVFALVSRGRRQSSTDVARMLDASNSRFEEMLDDLARELERAQAEGRRSRELAAIGSTIDLDTVLSRALESAAALPLVEAAFIVVPTEDDGPVVAAIGMSSEEASRHPVASAAADPDARAVEISYRYAPERSDGKDDLIRGGLVLPLRGEGEEGIGTLAVFWRHHDRDPSDNEVASLEDLAAKVGPAVENARKFREARKLADLDALTSLHNRRFFHDTLAREVARAQRYDRRLALLIFDIDDFKAINERVGHLAGDSVLAQLAERVRSVVRSADIACRVGGDEFAVILPESGLADAEQLYRRLQLAVSTRPTGASERLHLSAGIAELVTEDDAVSFFERADEALFRAKETGKGQAVAANRSIRE